MFKERLISGVILLLVTIFFVISGGYLLGGLLIIVSIIGMRELYQIGNIQNKLLGIIGYAGAIVYYIVIIMKQSELIIPLILGILILTMTGYVFTFPKFQANHVMLTFFGLFYVAVMLSYVYQVRELSNGIFTVWLVFLSSWGSDTCAYCVGVLFGKRKMAPILSPKKSVEGAIGGLLGAALLASIYALCINKFGGAEVEIGIYALIAFISAGISMVGDLAASGIKRDHGVKDYGKLIPGHGGILDRFDSVIFTAPIIYYLAFYLMN